MQVVLRNCWKNNMQKVVDSAMTLVKYRVFLLSYLTDKRQPDAPATFYHTF